MCRPWTPSKAKPYAIKKRKPFNALVEGLGIWDSGEGEIRTPGTIAGTPVFETGAFNRSATSPGVFAQNHSGVGGGGQKRPKGPARALFGFGCAAAGGAAF